MDRFEAMSVFVAVAEQRGFARAAKRLGLSRSAVTRLVAALEDQLSIRLLQRTTRSVTLTDAGARYLERARRILSEVDDAERAARAQRSEPAGRFVLSAPQVFGRREVAPLLHDFLVAHPAVIGELTLADRVVNIVEEGVDLAVRIGFLDDSSLRSRQVGTTRRVVVASPEYLAANKRLRGATDLTAHRTILFTSLTPLPEWRFRSTRGELRVPIRPAFSTNDAEAAIGLAERGGGLAMVLAYQVLERVQMGRLQIVLAKSEPPPLPIQLVYPSTRLLSATVRAFIDMTLATRKWTF